MTHSELCPCVLVAGTTCDYIDWLRNNRPSASLFITRQSLRDVSSFAAPLPREELLIGDDWNQSQILNAVIVHMHRYQLMPVGIVAFDCESLLLAAFLAEQFGLSYPKESAIKNCRCKINAVNLWRSADVQSPFSKIVTTVDESVSFYADAKKRGVTACVIKPLSGSGSEHTFLCGSDSAVRKSFELASAAMERRKDEPMFSSRWGGSSSILMEDYAIGVEYSVDFFVPTSSSSDSAAIVRLCRKYPLPQGPFGTTGAYEPLVCDSWPVSASKLSSFLYKAATVVGLYGIVCMADLIICNGEITILEIAPRPAGDCLLPFMKQSWNLDTAALVHDLASGCSSALAEAVAISNRSHPRYIALRFFAEQNGIITKYDTAALESDPRVVSQSLSLSFPCGHCVTLPPLDFDSRILGFVVYCPVSDSSVEQQNEEIRAKFRPVYYR